MNFEKLNRQLLLTQNYCSAQLKNTEKNYASILRSINPTLNGEPLFKFDFVEISASENFFGQYVYWTKDPYEIENEGLIEELFDTQLKIKEETFNQLNESGFEGEIFAFHFDETLVDGAACVSSFGLLDDYNCPPIDTWFYIQNRTLLAWIPKELVDYAEDGISVNPESCIEWYKDVEFETYSTILKQNNLTKVVNTNGLPDWLKR
ncbi:hypothetical protein [Pontibacter sp. G13]|uniref:hypothetical protein n=1 Tax=Pontibacter sp. G13 TaxID=3074898 RepID=UPI00288A624C|nr:hypothetical protein [Pontibacter sp. G13]WNJ18250.1 hypothetical protein RJD25_25645 [Pontibacter sp. G13]